MCPMSSPSFGLGLEWLGLAVLDLSRKTCRGEDGLIFPADASLRNRSLGKGSPKDAELAA